MKALRKTALVYCKNAVFSLLGVASLTILLLYTVLSLPLFLHRWLVVKVFVRLFRQDLSKVVTVQGSSFAFELEEKSNVAPPRCAVVLSMELDGEVGMEVVKSYIETGWLSAATKYPEFRQSIESWMGFIFWKEDKAFSIDNHLNQIACDDTWTEGHCEEFVRSRIEELLNKPFLGGRSPWEIQLVKGYLSSNLTSGGKKVSIIIMRFHHSMVDGYSMMYALCEGLLGMSLTESGIATPSQVKARVRNELHQNFIAKLVHFVGFPLQILRDAGYGLYLILVRRKSPWYIPDGRKAWRHIYSRSGSIPISNIKYVKDKFGVSFTSVLLSSIAAGVTSSFQRKGGSQFLETLPLGLVLPVKDHPNKLRNHWTASVLELPIDQTLDPLRRLKRSEKLFQGVKRSSIPILYQALIQLFGGNVAPISRLLSKNRTVSSVLTNFPGPGILLGGKGLNLITIDSAAGLSPGGAGVGFMVLSYCDHIRIAATAECAVMDRQELEGLIGDICSEIERLYQMAVEEKNLLVRIDPDLK